MTAIQSAEQLLDMCAIAYNGKFGQGSDLDNGQIVAHYQNPENMKKYVHMYFAKHVQLWRIIQGARAWAKRPFISFGAGPGLCALGWQWDGNPCDCTLIDALDWSAITSTPSYQALWAKVGGRITTRQFSIPPTGAPPQLTGVQVPRFNEAIHDSTVAFSFILNHLVGKENPISAAERGDLFSWINRLRASNDVIIADFSSQYATAFWAQLSQGLGAPSGVPVREWASPTDLGNAYNQEGHRRIRDVMCKASVIRGDATGWYLV